MFSSNKFMKHVLQITTSYEMISFNGSQLGKMKKSIPDMFPAMKFIWMKQLV